MPRPSLIAERREEILDAIERCVIREGFHGVTLEGIAEEAGLKRSLLRHNVGNREQLLQAFVDRYFQRSQQASAAMVDYLPKKNRVQAIIDMLFDANQHNSNQTLLAMALTIAANDQPSLRRQLNNWNKDFIALVADEVNQEFTKVSTEQCQAVATGIVSIYFNMESMGSLGSNRELLKSSKQAAQLLLASLRGV